ncbi:hypothetical protein [Amycolatopsis rifamycinica]|uniref:Uncharacterized protein n=1 Tax=Amycolatopsis rifamycinica TaxID=287986 RepID=A0A066UB34_9PSEU|nr:hypothetical protein [Amycolatopsis rifamycinica]KDN21443.1 hypothetical protein DV20_16290 [Amycolatopsis rifamycinica]
METFVLAADAQVVPDWRVLGWGLVAGAGATLVMGCVLGRLARRAPGAELPGGAQWKFTDSWASNLTALTAAFATLLAAFSGKLDAAISAGASTAFAVASAFYVAVAACAPIAYTVGQKEKTARKAPTDPMDHLVGSPRGLVAGACLTLLSVFSSLASVIFVLVFGAKGALYDLSWIAVVILLAMATLVAIYAFRTVRWLLTPRGRGATLPGITGFTCCEPPEAVTRRVFLL